MSEELHPYAESRKKAEEARVRKHGALRRIAGEVGKTIGLGAGGAALTTLAVVGEVVAQSGGINTPLTNTGGEIATGFLGAALTFTVPAVYFLRTAAKEGWSFVRDTFYELTHMANAGAEVVKDPMGAFKAHGKHFGGDN